MTRKPEKSGERLLDVLILVFISLAVYASSSIQRALGPGKPSSGDVTDAAHSDGDVEKAVGASPSGQATQNEAPLQELGISARSSLTDRLVRRVERIAPHLVSHCGHVA